MVCDSTNSAACFVRRPKTKWEVKIKRRERKDRNKNGKGKEGDT